MNRLIFPLLLAGAVLVAAPSQAQTKKKSSDGWGAADDWGTPAPKKAAVAPAKKASAAPAVAEEAPATEMAPAPASEMTAGRGGFGGASVPSAAPEMQPGGSVVAPGFTAAPSHRVTTDYRGRPIAPYVRRNVRRPDPVVTRAPAPEPEPAPLVEATAPEPAASATATKTAGGATSAAKKAAPVAAPKKAAPAKKKDDGWGSGGSGW